LSFDNLWIHLRCFSITIGWSHGFDGFKSSRTFEHRSVPRFSKGRYQCSKECKQSLIACAYQNHDYYCALIIFSVYPNIPFFILQDGVTALWCASSQGHIDIVKFLVTQEADVNAHADVNCEYSADHKCNSYNVSNLFQFLYR